MDDLSLIHIYAGLLVSEGKTAASASSITFGTGNTFTLGNNAALTLGDATQLMESFSSTVMGGTNSSLACLLYTSEKGLRNGDEVDFRRAVEASRPYVAYAAGDEDVRTNMLLPSANMHHL